MLSGVVKPLQVHRVRLSNGWTASNWFLLNRFLTLPGWKGKAKTAGGRRRFGSIYACVQIKLREQERGETGVRVLEREREGFWDS